MLSSLKHRDTKREEGFTLIELLVVVIIIGILAAIAIPVFLNQREKAWQNAVESDLRNAAIQMESFFTDTGTGYPDATEDINDAGLEGFTTSKSVSLAIKSSSSTEGYCLQASHELIGADTQFRYATTAAGEKAPVEGTCSEL